MHEPTEKPHSLPINTLHCDECGNPDAIIMAGKKLCPECLQLCGSCCGNENGND